MTMGGRRGQLRAERLPPDHHQQLPALGADPGRHVRPLPRVHGRGHQAEPRPSCTENIDRSVMMVTALSPVIGYDKASAISHYAIDHDLTLKQAALAKGVSEELFDRVVDPPRPDPPRHRRCLRHAKAPDMQPGNGEQRARPRATGRQGGPDRLGRRRSAATPTGPIPITGCGGCWRSSSAWPG